MSNKIKRNILYITLNILHVLLYFHISKLTNNITVVTIFAGFYVLVVIAVKWTKVCPFMLFSRYILRYKHINFIKLWKRAYNDRLIFATSLYGNYVLFIFILLILFI